MVQTAKSAVLSPNCLAKKEEIFEIINQTLRDFQRNNMNRNKADDVFQNLMNAFTETYDPHTEYFFATYILKTSILIWLSLEELVPYYKLKMTIPKCSSSPCRIC